MSRRTTGEGVVTTWAGCVARVFVALVDVAGAVVTALESADVTLGRLVASWVGRVANDAAVELSSE